jgi:F-type H+-transporting ATPase subunit delta
MAEKSKTFDRDAQQIGQSYATALLGAAEKSGKLEQVVGELESFVTDCLLPLPKLTTALESPRVPVEAKLSMIDKAVAGKVSSEFHNFLRVVANHGRFDCLAVIAQEARKQLNEKLGRVEVQLRSAFSLDDALLARIREQLKASLGSEIDLKTEVEPKLIGGLEIRIGDTVYDGTIVRQLSRLREQAVQKVSEEIRHRGERFTTA